jgi:hypothetical protein
VVPTAPTATWHRGRTKLDPIFGASTWRTHLQRWWDDLTAPASDPAVAALLGYVLVARGPLIRTRVSIDAPTCLVSLPSGRPIFAPEGNGQREAWPLCCSAHPNPKRPDAGEAGA